MKTLLVIDPDAGFHGKVKELLKPGQVELVSTDNGSDAVQLATDLTPDMIILNLELKDLNGFLVCSSLKKNPTTRGIPLVITSAIKKEEDFDQHRKLKFRADGYFRKPLSSKELGSLLIDFLGSNAVQKKKETPLGTDFDEENIDKLLDSTFTAFSTDGSQSEAEASNSSEAPEELPEASPIDFSDDAGEEFNLELELKEEEKDIDLPAPLDLSDLEEESAPHVDTGDLEMEGDEAEETSDNESDTEPDIKTQPENVLRTNQLKHENQQKSVQIITLQKENEFLKSENRNLLMDLTSLKADIAEREEELAVKKEKIKTENEEMRTRMEATEAQLATEKTKAGEQAQQYQEMEERNLKLEEEVDRLQKENQGFKGELEELKKSNEESLSELNRQLLAEEAKVQDLKTKNQEFGEKETMLMTTIENLTKNTRELENELKANREKLKHLSDIFKSAAAEVDAPES